jgi:threonine/homoserine/homoserine lactone efflux protein
MTLLIILTVVFCVVALMVILGERFGSPMDEKQQSKFARITQVLVFILLISALLKMLFS